MKILVILLFLSSVFTLSACTTTLKPKIVHPHTPLSAAKDFVDALTSGSTVELNQVTYKSQSMPTDKIMGSNPAFSADPSRASGSDHING